MKYRYVSRTNRPLMERKIKVYTIKEGYELGNSIPSKVLAFAFSLSTYIQRNLFSQRTKEAMARLGAKAARLPARKVRYKARKS